MKPLYCLIVVLMLIPLLVQGCQQSRQVSASAPSPPVAPVPHPDTVAKHELVQPAAASPTSAPSPQLQSLTVRVETYVSKAMGGARSYGIVLPPDYDRHPHQRYPVIFLLHGGHGNSMDWLNPQKGNAAATLEQLYATRKLMPCIVVTPDGNDRRGSSPYHDPEYIDGVHGKVSTAIGEELVQVIQSRYRTLPSPDYWAIGGLSSGGWGALNIGLHHPNHFSVLFSHSGYFVDQSGANNSPMLFVAKSPIFVQQQIKIYLDTGAADAKYLEQNQQFHQRLDQLGIENVLEVFPGAHSWRYWRQHLADSLSFVETAFQSLGH